MFLGKLSKQAMRGLQRFGVFHIFTHCCVVATSEVGINPFELSARWIEKQRQTPPLESARESAQAAL